MRLNPIHADQASITVTVPADIATTFRIFTEDIDQWWRRGVRFRHSGSRRGMIHLEPKAGGRLFDAIETEHGDHIVEAGQVVIWQPPTRLVLEWRASNSTAEESTEVEVNLIGRGTSTEVRLTHRGFAALRANHPVRHGYDGTGTVRMIGLWWKDQFENLLLHF